MRGTSWWSIPELLVASRSVGLFVIRDEHGSWIRATIRPILHKFVAEGVGTNPYHFDMAPRNRNSVRSVAESQQQLMVLFYSSRSSDTFGGGYNGDLTECKNGRLQSWVGRDKVLKSHEDWSSRQRVPMNDGGYNGDLTELGFRVLQCKSGRLQSWVETWEG